MTFLAGTWLVLLLAPVLVLLAYIYVQRRRHRVAVRFTSVDLLSSVAPRRSGWQRHIAPALLALALATLVVAVARPAYAQRIPRDRATIIVVIDTSASMAATDVAPTRLQAAEAEARHFVAQLPGSLQVGLITFDQTARVVIAPTSDRTTVQGALSTLPVGQGTATGEAIYLSLNAIQALPDDSAGNKASAAIVLLSDGTPTIGRGEQTPQETVDAAATAAKQAGVPINTIAFGTASGVVNLPGRTVPAPSDPDTMASIASQTGGKSFTAKTAGQLKSVYSQIQKSVGYEIKKREVTVWATGVALALALAAAAASLVWSQRIV
ncbi:MAG: VWA domain-containing protein [Actinomycetes bacterium]